jgi:hypothetical protein
VIPLYYLISNTLNEPQENAVRSALSITPLSGILISDLQDGEFAHRFVKDVLLVRSPQQAEPLAHEFGRSAGPVAVVGPFKNLFTAVHEDGTEEVIHVGTE